MGRGREDGEVRRKGWGRAGEVLSPTEVIQLWKFERRGA